MQSCYYLSVFNAALLLPYMWKESFIMNGLQMVYIAVIACFLGNVVAISLLVREVQELRRIISKREFTIEWRKQR